MTNSRFVIWMFSVGVIVLGADGVSGQDYPNKPIRILTSPSGGSNDFAARLIAQELSESFGQPVIVDNRPGIIAIETVAKASTDGYTLLNNGSTFWIGPLLRNMSYDPVRDFAPITLATRSPNILVVHPSVPVKSVKELIAFAKAKPGSLNYASGPTGTTNHLSAELFKYMTGVNIVRITYKGGVQALNGLLGGETQLLFASSASMGSMIPLVKSGKLRALAVTSAERSALFPELPTIAASGLPGYEAEQTLGMFAPAKTPEAIITRLNQEIVRALKRADVQEKFLHVGVETVGTTTVQFAAMIKSEMARLGKVIKDANIRAD